MRPTWQARDMIPKDIICMNWFWSYGERYDGEVKDFPVVFGNFRGYGMNNYHKRCGEWLHRRNVLGLGRNKSGLFAAQLHLHSYGV